MDITMLPGSGAGDSDRAAGESTPGDEFARLMAELGAGAELVFDGPEDRCPCHARGITAA